jgi:hypothetical protein
VCSPCLPRLPACLPAYTLSSLVAPVVTMIVVAIVIVVRRHA